MSSHKRTRDERWEAVGRTARNTGALLGGTGALMGLLEKGKTPKERLAKAGIHALSGAIGGGLAGGWWKGATEIGGSLDDDNYLGRVLGGLVGGGPPGAALSALDTYLLKRKMENE